MVKMLRPEELEVVQRGGEVSSRDKGELVFEVKLPSKGLHGYGLKGGIVVCRPLKVKDIKPLIFTRIENEVSYLRRVVEVVGNTVVEPKGFDVYEMTWNDFIKLLVACRVNSLGSVVEIGYRCEKCGEGEQQFWKLDLVSDLEEVELDDSYGQEPVEVEGVKVRYPRLRAFLREDISSIDDVTDYDLVKDAVIDMNVDELEVDKYFKIVDWIKRWSGYGVKDRVKVRCGKCKKEVEATVPFFLLLVGGRVI